MIGTTVTPSWTAPGGDPVADAMSRRARVFAPGFIAVTDMLRITVSAGPGGMIVTSTIGPGFCYRIVVATMAVVGAELVLAPLGGDLIQGEQAPDGGALLGYLRPLCIPSGSPPVSTRLRIRSLVASGEVGLQIFATPFGG